MGILTDKEILIAKLTGDFNTDREFLIKESEKMAAEGNKDGANAAMELLFERMPESEKKKIEDLVYVNGKRLDAYYSDIEELIKEKKIQEALPMAKALYEKIITTYPETDDSKFVSLRNKFEQNVYQLMYKPEKTLNVAPFDFARMITTYGYLLVDVHELDEAEVVLKKASEYNPVDCGPKFELAEAYKLSRKNDELLAISKETLKISSSPYAMARCYCNLGFYCYNVEDYENAAVFYYISILFAPHRAVEMELKNVALRLNKKLTPPKEADIDRTFEKYGITRGPEELLVSVAAQLATLAIERNDIEEALMNLKLLYGLTNDENIKKTILKYEPDALEKARERFGITEPDSAQNN